MSAEADKIIGVSIVGVASFLYAAGLCIQRAALTVDDPDGPVAGCRGACCRKRPTANWVLGLCIYGIGGLFLSTMSLRYIPLSLSSSVFSSVLIFNAVVARLWLKEPVMAVDIVCYALIMGGITVDAYYLPDTPRKIDVQVLEELWEQPLGIGFWAVVLFVLISLQVLILVYLERKHEVDGAYAVNNRGIYRLAMVSYPVALGIWEGVAYMCLKAANDIFDHISDGRDDQSNHWLFWFGCSLALPMCAVIVMWVRKSYKRFPTTQIFPLELGALTVVSVNGGLLFFEEYKGAKTHELYLCYGGVALMITAMITLAWYKSSLGVLGGDSSTAGGEGGGPVSGSSGGANGDASAQKPVKAAADVGDGGDEEAGGRAKDEDDDAGDDVGDTAAAAAAGGGGGDATATPNPGGALPPPVLPVLPTRDDGPPSAESEAAAATGTEREHQPIRTETGFEC